MTIVIADDHPIFRQGLRQLPSASPYSRWWATLATARRRSKPSNGLSAHAVLDIDMPGMDGPPSPALSASAVYPPRLSV